MCRTVHKWFSHPDEVAVSLSVNVFKKRIWYPLQESLNCIFIVTRQAMHWVSRTGVVTVDISYHRKHNMPFHLTAECSSFTYSLFSKQNTLTYSSINRGHYNVSPYGHQPKCTDGTLRLHRLILMKQWLRTVPNTAGPSSTGAVYTIGKGHHYHPYIVPE